MPSGSPRSSVAPDGGDESEAAPVSDMARTYRICVRCVSDTSLPGIRFDDAGVCRYCRDHDVLEGLFPLGDEGLRRLDAAVARIKHAGRKKPYDCICGVSGGRDSTYSLYLAVKHGLRPLAVHFDNGWNSEVADRNIRNACSRLKVDLHTHVADRDEFKDLQIAFLRASVPEAEVPTDIAIHGALHQAAVKEGLHHIILGHSFRTEGIAPIEWTYMDGRYLRTIRKRFGARPQKTVPNFTAWDYFYYAVIKRIQVLPILNYVPYVHSDAMRTLTDELGWEYYGGHHHESSYTHFCQSALFGPKFNIDKRRLECSAMVRSGQIGREEALADLTDNPYPVDAELVEYCVRKLGLTLEQWAEILAEPPRSFHDYPSYYPLIRALRGPLKIAYKLGLLSPVLYFKFLG